MLLGDLLYEFGSGTPIRRKHWGNGYIVYEGDRVAMYIREGLLLGFTPAKTAISQFSNRDLLQDGWEIAEDIEKVDITKLPSIKDMYGLH